jgi:hypothetical protein
MMPGSDNLADGESVHFLSHWNTEASFQVPEQFWSLTRLPNATSSPRGTQSGYDTIRDFTGIKCCKDAVKAAEPFAVKLELCKSCGYYFY